MRKDIILFCLIGILVFMVIPAHTQVGINYDNSLPDSSAGLDVKFTDKGFLPPRMTLQERNAINNPANGLMVICTDCSSTGALSIFFSGSGWITVSPCNTPAPVEGTHIPSGFQIIWNWSAVAGAIGYKWNDTNDYSTAIDIGTEITRTEIGLNCNTACYRYIWAYFPCGTSAVTSMLKSTLLVPVSPPVAGTNVPSLNQVVWNWHSVEGATGYKWSHFNNVYSDSTAIDVGKDTSYNETGLANTNTYTRYVWAYNGCQESQPTTMTQSMFYPGMPYQGGIIFYIYQPGDHGYVPGETHGLIASPTDQDMITDWGCPGIQWIGGTNDFIGYGSANTAAIVNGCGDPGTAARICYDLSLNGYNDWFLPSIDELNQLFIQRYVVGGFNQCAYGWYWSSSEYLEMSGQGMALAMNMNNGTTSNWQKFYPYVVRAIRAF